MKEKLEKVVQITILLLIALLAGVAALMCADVGIQMMNLPSTIMVVLGVLVLICSVGVFAVGIVAADAYVNFVNRKNKQ